MIAAILELLKVVLTEAFKIGIIEAVRTRAQEWAKRRKDGRRKQ